MGSVRSSPIAVKSCGFHTWWWQGFCNLCLGSWSPKKRVSLASTLSQSLFFIFVFLSLISMNLVTTRQKFHGKLIVFGSSVFDDIRNPIVSVVFESVNIFLYGFVVLFFSYLQMITFSTFVGFGLRVSSRCVLLDFKSH